MTFPELAALSTEKLHSSARNCLRRLDNTVSNTRAWLGRSDWDTLDPGYRAKVCRQTAKDLRFYVEGHASYNNANALLLTIGSAFPHLQLELLRARHEALGMIELLDELAPVLEASARLLTEDPLSEAVE